MTEILNSTLGLSRLAQDLAERFPGFLYEALDQKIAERDQLEEGFRELVSHPWFIGGRQLDPKRIELFYMACYDLDKFRSFIFESSFLERFDLEPDLLQQLERDDEQLLQFAFRWLRFAVFGEPTMKVRQQDAAQTE